MKTENKYLCFNPPVNTVKYKVKQIVHLVCSVGYRVNLNVVCPPKTQRKRYNVSLCAIFRDEAKYLKEWVEFHKIVGVEHFYLYNNFSTDNYLEILEPYIQRNEVTLVDWEIPQGQMAAYQDCVEKNQDDAEWIGFIDLDEFVVPNKFDTIGQFLEPFKKNRPVVIVYWKMFGSAGKITRAEDGLVVEDFTVGWNKYLNMGKFFYNTSYEYDQTYRKNAYMHLMWGKYKNKRLAPVNCFNKICAFGIHPVHSMELPIQINHYVIKSYGEYVDKKSKRGGGVHAEGFHTLNYFWHHESYSQKVDYNAYKYLIQLKLRMQNKDVSIGADFHQDWRG